jgi:16S rRNA (guanine527-N7)-methyltransferase
MTPDLVQQLNQLLADSGLQYLQVIENKAFIEYYSLIVRWNDRINLTAIRDREAILQRHFVESIACARSLPPGIATLLDYGSGAGFPGIPIAICRPEMTVTLAESQGKKAAFLREAIRTTGISACVHAGRAETLHVTFDCVTLRAVDRMNLAVSAASRLIAERGWLAAMITRLQIPAIQGAAGAHFSWLEPIHLPGSEGRVLILGRHLKATG